MREKGSKLFHSKTIAYAAGVLSILVLHYVGRIREYPYDAGVYWHEGSLYGLEKFSIYNYNYPLRGYLFPLFTYAIRKLAFEGLGTERKVFCVVTSLLYSFFFMILLPQILKIMFEIIVPLWSRLIFTAVCIIMFRGMILYPLTDLFGLMCMCIAIYFYLMLMQDRVKKRAVRVLYAIGMGMALGGAYYVRPVYLITWIAFAGIMLFEVIRTKKWILLFGVIGIFLIAMPQVCINHKHFNTWSPMIQTQLHFGESLYLSQLEWGVSMQKYETNIDDTVEDIPAGMVFEDLTGKEILEEGGGIDSYFSYVRFCFRHLADMACIYLKHIFNGMDIVYPMIYIKNVFCNRFVTQLINYTLIFFGIEGLLFFIKKKCWNRLIVSMAVTYCLPILLVVPTAVETRFFVGAHIVLYLFGVAALTNRDWWNKFVLYKWKKVGIYILFLGICFLLNSQTFNCYGIPLW